MLSAADLSLFEAVGDTVREQAPALEAALRQTVFEAVDGAVRDTLAGITLKTLADEAKLQRGDQAYMFFI